MGLSISALISEWLGDKKARILCVGLDCAGKVCEIHMMTFTHCLDHNFISTEAQ